jgi:all-trans-retinol 13,14-reductase
LSFELAIVGSGLGGLLSGYLLSKEGMKVCVLEKHRKFGGNLQSFKRGDYHFDTGMHYIGGLAPGQTLYNYWKYFGLADHPNLVRMDENGFDLVSYPGCEFPIAQGLDNFRERLLPFFPGAENALKTYTETLEAIAHDHPLYHLEQPGTTSGHRFESLNAWDFLSKLHPVGRGVTQALSTILTGNGFLYAFNPSFTPLHQYGLINHSFISSAWRFAGGSQQIADHLAEGIRANGGTVLEKREVRRITGSEGNFLLETTEGSPFTCEKIISNIHPAATLKLIDGIPVQKAFRDRIVHLENTISVFSLYLGLKPDSFPYLNHNLYLHTLNKGWPESFILMTPPQLNQGNWAHTAVVLSPIRYEEFGKWEDSVTGRRDRDYWIYRAQRSQRLLETVYIRFPELRQAIASVDISTPLTWRDYTGTPQGSMYGIVKDSYNPLRTTVLPKTKVPGLFFTGQNVNLHGAVGVTIGAVMTCGKILGLPYVLKTIKNAL